MSSPIRQRPVFIGPAAGKHPLSILLSTRFATLSGHGLYLATGAAVRLLVAVGASPILIRLLGVERYGVWAVVNSVLALSIILEPGLNTAATQALALDWARRDWRSAGENLGTSLVMVTVIGGIASMLLWLASPSLGRLLFRSGSDVAEVAAFLTVCSGLILLRGWVAWANAVEAAVFRYGCQTVIDTVSFLMAQAGTIVLAALGTRLPGLGTWLLLSSAATVALHSVLIGSLCQAQSLPIRFRRRRAASLLRFGVTQWVSDLGSALFGHVDRIVVNFVLGPSVAGLYSVGTSVISKVVTLSTLPLQVVAPAVSAARATGSLQSVRNLFLRATRVNGLIAFLTASTLGFLSAPLADILVGRDHADNVSTVLLSLALAYGLYALNTTAFHTAIGIGAPVINAKWAVLGGCVTCILVGALGRIGGLSCAVYGNLGYLLTLFINWQVAASLRIHTGEYLRVLLLHIGAIAVCWLAAGFLHACSPPFWVNLTVCAGVQIALLPIVAGRSLLHETYSRYAVPVSRAIFADR